MKAQFLIYFINNQTNIIKKKKIQLTIRNNSLNQIKLKEISLRVEEEKNRVKELYDGY